MSDVFVVCDGKWWSLDDEINYYNYIPVICISVADGLHLRPLNKICYCYYTYTYCICIYKFKYKQV